MNIYQILETLRQIEESVAQIGDRVQCPNNITGTIVSDAGSHWIVIDDHAETEDDTLEFRKSDCQVINGLSEGQMKELMLQDAESMNLGDFQEAWGDDDWVREFWEEINDYDQGDWERDHPEVNDTDDLPSDHVYRSGGDPYDRPEPQSEGIDDDDYEDDEGDYVDDPRVHAATQKSAPLPDHVQQQIVRNPAMRADIIAAYKRQQGMAEGSKFAFANPKQRPGDQVRGTERAVKKKSGEHPFKGRLVGATEAKATKTRLDPKCWSGKKIGNPKTKVKGGVRVNNCVPMEEEYEQYMNELVGTYGMTSGGTANGASQTNTADQAKKVADTQADVQKLKAAGVPMPSTTQATQSLMKEPGKDPESQLDKNISAGLGQEVVQAIINKGDSGDVNQLTALIRKVNQKSGV